MAWLENQWARISLPHLVLVPASLAFRSAVALRHMLYRTGVLAATKLPIPVIVVGNITVGGTGKTPVVLWMVNYLCGHGMRPGIVSRGYGGAAASPRQVTADSDPASCGDEPVMLAQRSGVPVWIGADRAAAACALLGNHPECDVIVTDDGLQHYRLARDVEIAVVDGARGFGNGLMLPAGPLREPVARLSEVDAVVINDPGPAGIVMKCRAQFAMTLQSRGFQNLLNPDHRAAAELFHNRNVHAVAGIGNPRRFFEQLQRMGLAFTAHPFPDHHAFSAPDLALADADFIVMTEKDAVKCRSFATEKHWVLRVDAEIDPAFGDLVLKKLGKSDGQ
jgi:tetraacyldisaccharide 4'-kinase